MSERKYPDPETVERFSQTLGVTQSLQKDIIQFLTSKYTSNATLTVAEVMKFYDCPEDRARRVIANLVTEGVLEAAGGDTYRVTL